MRFFIYAKLLKNSLVRNKLVSIVLIVQLSISIILISFILSFLNSGYHTIKDQVLREKDATSITLIQLLPFKNLINYEQEWRRDNKIQRLSYIASTQDQVSYRKKTIVLPIFAVNSDYILYNSFPLAELQDDKVVLTVSSAERIFPNRNFDDIIGEAVDISGKSYVVAAVEQRSLVDRVYISSYAFQETYGEIENIIVGSIIVDEASAQFVLEELNSYSPYLIENKVIDKFQSFIFFLVIASCITVLLVFYSTFNFVQLYSFKVNKDKHKWDIFFLLGAKRANLKAYIYCEVGFITLLSVLISIIGFSSTYKLIAVEGITFRLDLIVLAILITIVALIVALTVELTVRKLKINEFK